MEASNLLKRYRSDRRKLIQFLLSSNLITELRTPSGPTASLSDIDIDSLSADYILDCVKSGGIVDVTEASRNYREYSALPVVIYSDGGNSYFTHTDPELSGSPPRHVPPRINSNHTASVSSASSQIDCIHMEEAASCGNDYRYREVLSTAGRPLGNLVLPSLGLPLLKTGLSDDDLRESAYELLLASILVSRSNLMRIVEHPVENRKKDKSSNFLKRLKSRKEEMNSEKVSPQSLSCNGEADLMNTLRGQMQVSEIMDACIRRNLRQLAARETNGHIDIPCISLGLLSGVFKSDFLNEKSYRQWKTRQANLLEECLCFCVKASTADYQTIISSVEKIRDAKEWDALMTPERVAILASIRQVVVKYSSLPGTFGMQGETCYWTTGYHLNFKLYQKLLFGVFDVLDEAQLIEEADEFVSLIKMTWPTLGITAKLHHAFYGWVLFQQFVATGEGLLLEYAVLELQKVLSVEQWDEKEERYLKSLTCSMPWNGNELKLSPVQNIFLSISIFCDSKMHDYHLNFCQKSLDFRMVMTLVSVVGLPMPGRNGRIKLIKLNDSDDNCSRILKSYVKSSTEAAVKRIATKIDLESKVERKQQLALLANEVKLIAEREFKTYYPVLHHWCPESLMISVVILHQFYGEKLKPFLEKVSSLTGDAKLVLPAADMLDNYLSGLYAAAVEANRSLSSCNLNLIHYEIAELTRPLILDWVISQHTHIFEWTGRAFDIEDWERLSFHQRQAASIIEVFRILEETVDQFFGLNLPMDITHLQALLSIIFHCLNAYLLKMLDQLVDKNHLYPQAAPLTRYTETTMPMIKRKLLECPLPEDGIKYKLDQLTIAKLCVRLNTLHYIEKQVEVLEDGMRKSWMTVQQFHHKLRKAESQEEAIDALFATTLSIIRDTAIDAFNKFCDFTGARVVFWDLRDRFLFQLYRSDVKSTRLELFLHHIDSVLDQLCGLIEENLRDRLVLSVFQALLEGFIWILLGGGPSRAFSESDVVMMEDDLNMLKEFFVADGEGLPRSIVEEKSKFAGHILHLFSLQTGTLIQLLMNASENISLGLGSCQNGEMNSEDAHNLIRVLCHKKDGEASKFLKRQYELPMSSEYEDMPFGDSSLRSRFIPDLISRSKSFHPTNNGQTSFTSLKKKLQEATSELRSMSMRR